MGQLHRFYVPDLEQQAGAVQLSGDELHHALRVVRVRAGESVRLFDGAGRWCDAAVIVAGRREVELSRGDIHVDPRSDSELTLGQAWLNHERSIESIVQRGTELGVDKFVFFRGQHSERAPRGAEKWARWAIESCKQCGRNRLPEFQVVDAVTDAITDPLESACLIATQHATPVALSNVLGDRKHVVLLVGTEGDFTADEVAGTLERGARPISLGPYTLRSEVAATVAVALVQRALGRLGS